MRMIVLTDIDDTLMHTARKSQGGDLAVGAVSRSGNVSSFMSPKQVRLWSLLQDKADEVVPVTARSAEGLRNVQLPFKDGAVVDFGAQILKPDGAEDRDWAAQMLSESAHLDQHATFLALRDILNTRFELSATRIQMSGAIAAYLLLRVDNPQAHAELLAYTKELLACSPDDFYLHVTDRDLCVLPRFVGKGHAVRHLYEERGWAAELVLGLGDSLTDADFMTETDFLLAPGRSRLAGCLMGAVVAQGEAL